MRFGIFFVFAIFFGKIFAAGLAVQPMEQFVTPTKSASYAASNRSDKAIAVEVVVESWTITETGEELRAVSTDLIAYPSQFILKGHTFKSIKVGLRAPLATLDTEKCYRVTIRELPISLEPDEPGTFRIHHASAYSTSYYLQPAKPQPRVEFVDAKLDKGQLTLRFRNVGNVHYHLRNPELVFVTSDGKRLAVTDKDLLRNIAGENVHAGIVRAFLFDLTPMNIPDNIVGGSIRFHDNDLLDNETFDFKV